jgi:two-component system cell cycle sensor histidine kinase/response regulator CckA
MYASHFISLKNSLVKDVTIPTEPVRPAIVLRPSTQGPTMTNTGPVSGAPAPQSIAQPVTEPTPSPRDSEIQQLREELANCHTSLTQWTQAEVEWSQQRRLFQIMTEGTSDFIVLLDHQGHRTWSNPAYSNAMGYAPEELTGTHVLTEVHADDRARATEALNHSLLEGATQQAEYRVQQKDGGWLNLLAETIAVLDPEGRVESVVLLALNQTENKKLTEALALAQTEATAANMIEGMARDFDQILTNVFGNLTIAKNLNGPHNAIAVRLNEMERALQRARDLIEQMFTITPEQGEPKVRVAFEPVVQEAVASVLRGTMIRAEYLFPRNLPEVEIDKEAFSHAIRNIVTNSVEAMDKGVVRFSAENIPHSQFSYRPDLPLKVGDYICLHIQDQGHGISEKALPRIFEPYFTTRSGSQGLGLTTALSSVQRMGGTILVESTPGVGTTVSLYLPAATGTAPKPSTQALPTAAAVTGQRGTAAIPKPGTAALPLMTHGAGAMATPGHKRRILLMDDEQMILDIVSRMLGHLGYEVTTCTDGSQAIAAFAKAKSHAEPFDVVMMDLVIPNGVGGQDAVHTIKKIDPSVRVIASSGHLEHPVMQDHKKFGFNAVLEKPYKLEKLQQVIEAVISAPAA